MRPALAALFSLILIIIGPPTGRGAALAPPQINASTFATYVAGPLTITGQGFGASDASRALRFTYDGATLDVPVSSASVTSWTDKQIDLNLPPEVHSGTVSVLVDNVVSTPADLHVFEYTTTDSPAPAGVLAVPLALAVDPEGTLWVNEEAHAELKSFSPSHPSVATVIPIPQPPGAGIFAYLRDGVDRVTRLSTGAEDVVIASDGAVWFTQGGGTYYDGALHNTSRVIRYTPSTSAFACYVVPADDAEVFGLVLDEARGMVWYAESDFEHGNTIGGFDPSLAPEDCLWHPDTGVRPVTCALGQSGACHRRYPMPRPFVSPAHLVLDDSGILWFTEYWGNAVGRLDPDAGSIIEFPLPAPIIGTFPQTYAGAGPWEIEFDATGDLWISEYFDATISRVSPSRMASSDCTRLDAGGRNPCIDEMFVGSDGFDGNRMHTVWPGADGRVWFAGGPVGRPMLGFIDTNDGDTPVLLPPLPGASDLAGITQDPVSGDVWIAQVHDRKIGRLRVATGDADGVPDASDNCPATYNPQQENHDRNFTDLSMYGLPFNDKTWPASDEMGDACDSDADNDGIPNTSETALPITGCAVASAPLDPLQRDFDGDGVLDGAECALGSDPAVAASSPPRFPLADADRDGLTDAFEATIGTNPAKSDTDGDRIGDGIEFRTYGSSPLNPNGDGDLCTDGKEVASINADQAVNASDLLVIARSFGRSGSAVYVPSFDLDRNGTINAADLATAAGHYGYCR